MKAVGCSFTWALNCTCRPPDPPSAAPEASLQLQAVRFVPSTGDLYISSVLPAGLGAAAANFPEKVKGMLPEGMATAAQALLEKGLGDLADHITGLEAAGLTGMAMPAVPLSGGVQNTTATADEGKVPAARGGDAGSASSLMDFLITKGRRLNIIIDADNRVQQKAFTATPW